MMSSPLVFYFVLSAKERFDPIDLNVPAFSSLSRFNIDLRNNGGVGSAFVLHEAANAHEELSLAQKGRALRVWSSFDKLRGSVVATHPILGRVIPEMVLDAARPELADSVPPGMLYVEHREPFRLHRFLTRNYLLYGYGLWTRKHEVLVLTNLENYDRLMRSSGLQGVWLSRMRPMEEANVSVNTDRICNRWARWKNTSTALTHPSERFALLESFLCSVVPPNSSQGDTYGDRN